MYILAQVSCFGSILRGVFTDIDKLNLAIRAIKISDADVSKLYYQEIEVNNFDAILLQFFTMHPEKLIEIDVTEEKKVYV